MRLGIDVIEAVAPNLIMPASFTPEALYELFNTLNPGDCVVWVKDELGGFFKSLEKRYMYGMRELLSSLYMGFGEVRKLRNLTLRIPNGLYVTAIGTAPTPPNEYLHEEDFTSGFMNRWLITHADRREKRLPLLHRSPKADEMFKEITARLKQCEQFLISTTPVLSPTGAAIEKLDEYDRETDREIERIEQLTPGSLLKMYLAETPMMLLKLSILRRLARGDYGTSGIVTIEREDVERAHQDLILFVESAKHVIEDVQSSPRAKPVVTEEKALTRVAALISSKGQEGASYSELLLRTRILAKELREYLLTLMEQERIICVRVPTGRSRPALKFFDAIYRNIALTMGQQVTADVLRTLLK
jgi:hypothetical protein